MARRKQKADESITRGVEQGEDRLSALPDVLLVEIISHLPIQSAVATSVLSRRWRYIWTQITHLSLNIFHMMPVRQTLDGVQGCHYFIAIVDHILRQLTSLKMHSFQLYFGGHNGSRDCQICCSRWVPWVELICARNVEVVSIRPFWSSTPIIRMPPCLFQTHSLEKLELSGHAFVFEVPDHVIVALPNLKTLNMDTIGSHDSHRELMRLLLKSCPQLEHLDLQFLFTENGHVVDISAPNLKSLVLRSDDEVRATIFMIDAPKLEVFRVISNPAIYHFVTIPTTLLKAEIIQGDIDFAFVTEADYLSCISGLALGISSTRSLLLDIYGLTLFSFLSGVGESVFPVFRNLTHIEIDSVSEVEMKLASPLPACFLGNVKKMQARITMCADWMQFLEGILCNATNLEELSVSDVDAVIGEPADDVFNFEVDLCKALFNLSKRYSGFTFEFSGDYVQASSNGC